VTSTTVIKPGQPLIDWTETEIRLRVCILLKRYDLHVYEGVKWHSEDEIYAIAKENRRLSEKSKANVLGGLIYNPPESISSGEQPSA
jgi:hypothetical protein